MGRTTNAEITFRLEHARHITISYPIDMTAVEHLHAFNQWMHIRASEKNKVYPPVRTPDEAVNMCRHLYDKTKLHTVETCEACGEQIRVNL